MVPFLGNVLEGEAEWFALAGRQRRCAEIDRIRIRAASLQNMQRSIFRLCDLSKRVLENDMDCSVGDGVITGIGNGAVEICYGRTHEVLGGAHFQIRYFEVRSVWMRSGVAFGLSSGKQDDDSYDDNHQHHPHQNGDPIRITLLCGRRRLDEAAHGGIVDCQFPIVDLRDLLAADGQAVDSDGRASDCATKFEVVTDFGNIEEDFFQVTCHRDFFYWVSEFTTGNPEAGRAT